LRTIHLAFLGLLALSCTLPSRASQLAFQPPIVVSTGQVTPGSFVVSDFNGDGKPDLVVADTPATSVGATGTISIYLNQAGSLSAVPIVTTLQNGDLCGTILAGDLNGDGKMDLVVGTRYANQVILVLLGNGDGTFKQLPEIPGSVTFISGKIADFNNDGHPDLFLGGNGSPYLYLGNGDGTFAPQSIPNGSMPGNYQSVVAGNFHGGKNLDAIATDYNNPPYTPGSLDIFPGDGTGHLANPVFIKPASIPYPLTVDAGDFNHDGKLDLVVGSWGAYILFGNGDGTFQTAAAQTVSLALPPVDESHITNPDTYNVVVADLDQNGAPDVAVLDSKTGLLSLFLNDGTGTFPNASATPYTFQFPPNTFAMAVADINDDGLPDIVMSNYRLKTVTLLLSKVNLTATTITLTANANNALVGTPLTFTANVTTTGSAPTGTVTLADGSTQIAQQTLDASGNATFTTSSLTAGSHSLTASYSGDTHFASSSSTSLNEAVTDFQVALTPATQTVAAGSPASYSLAVTPLGGFTGTISLSCSGLPSLASCNAQNVTVSSGSASQTITITTAAPTTAMSVERRLGFSGYTLLAGCTLCFGWMRRTFRISSHFLLLFLILVLPLALCVSGCGSGTSTKNSGTPSGTSAITITATFVQNGVTASHAATGTLIVQ
jgi:hypothetical protein